ncbi:hypothetical protein niasHS_017846 [Heterodera schachtii]|uniref:Transmembrane protein n=1 Tax=Heterodera schachtii TaxID=97005 RepID=A0ABD2I4P9_HETSC
MAAPVPFRADSNTHQYTASFPGPIYYRDTFGLEQQTDEAEEENEATMAAKFGAHSSSAVPPSLTFPPPLYYRDTFGLEPLAEDEQNLQTEERISVGSDETATTKSTVRHTIRIFHPQPSVPGPSLNRLLMFGQRRKQSGFSGVISQQQQQQQGDHGGGTGGHDIMQQSDFSHSFQVEEQLSTNHILLVHHRPLLWLFAVQLGTALQLLIFSVVCVFFDGHWLGSVVGVLLLLHSVLILLHLRRLRTRPMLIVCTVLSSAAFVLSLFLFFVTAYLIHTEDVRIRSAQFDITNPQAELERSNQIVQNARIAMYSLMLIYAPIYAICTFAMFFLFFKNYVANRAGRTHKGFFLTSPSSGHQRVLVPIKLHQVDNLEEEKREDEQQQQNGQGKETAKGQKGKKRRKGQKEETGKVQQTEPNNRGQI